MASSPPPPPRRTLRLTLPADALSPSLTFSPPLSWNFDGAWNLVNATGASISHTFAGERWALRGSANALVIAGPSADLTVDGIPTKSINTVGDEVVAAKVGEGWHTAKYSLSGYRGELSVYGATSELSIVADLSEDEFKALEQRVPLSEHGDNLVYDGWSAVEAAQGTMGTLVLNIPSNTSLFALSGTRGPAGTVQLTLTPPILDRGDFAADTALAAPSNDTALFTAPLDPQIQYAVNITGRGARLSALHYWPVSSDAFPWRRSSWSPPSSLLYIPPPPPSNPQSSLAQHRRKNIGAIVGGTIGGLVILSVLIIMALCECRRVRFFGARYRPRRGVSKRGISSSDLTRFDEHYFSVRSASSHESHDRTPTPFVEYNAYAGGLTRTPTLSTPTLNSPLNSPSLASSVPFSPALRASSRRDWAKATSPTPKSRYTHVARAPVTADMYSRPSLTETASVVSIPISKVGAPPQPQFGPPQSQLGHQLGPPPQTKVPQLARQLGPPPPPRLRRPPPIEEPRRSSYELRVREFMGVPQWSTLPGHARERVLLPVAPPRERLRQPSPAPEEWEPDNMSVYSGATIGKAI